MHHLRRSFLVSRLASTFADIMPPVNQFAINPQGSAWLRKLK